MAAAALGSSLGARDASAATLSPGASFNIPTGDTYDQNTILRKIIRGIDGSTSGETIRMAFFSLTVPRFVDALIAAHKRGVNVRLLQDDHEIGPQWQRVVAALGSDTTKRSWALLCHRSCHSDEDPSYLHAKLYMFSKSHGVPLVVMISSANPTFTQARVGWNDMYTVVRNTTIYTASRTYFEKMTAGALQDRRGDQTTGIPIDLYFTAESGIYKTYYFPKAGEGKADDPMYGVMSNITCRGTAFGYGSDGRTVIKVAMYQWSLLRIRLAEKLWELDDAGCIVEVIYHPTTTDPPIVAALTKAGGRNGGVKVTRAYEDRNGDGVAEHFLHNKFMIVNGIYLGDTSSKIVFTGSANWTNTALRYGNEIMLKINDPTTYAGYSSHFGRVLAWAKAVPPPPTPSPTPRPTPTRPPTPPPTAAPSAQPTVQPTPTLPPTPSPTLGPPTEEPPPNEPPQGAPATDGWSSSFLDQWLWLPSEDLPTDLE